MEELVKDQFGASIISEVFDPLLSEACGVASLAEEAESAVHVVSQAIEEARSIGGLYQ